MPDDDEALILRSLSEVAPDADLAGLDPDQDLRDALELDSMDFLNLVTEVSQAAGFDIPERAYPELSTLHGFAAYLGTHRPA